ncbi:MAG: hypothetical protein QM729_16625 [Solirubrobacterales bacterium]
MVETLAAPPRPSRRRRRPRDAEAVPAPPEVPVARATAIRAFDPFDGPERAAAWLTAATADEEAIDAVVAAAIALVNDALHAQAVAAADPHPAALSAERAVAVRIGYGSGEQTAEGTHTVAREVDVAAAGSRRRKRQDDLRPQERVGALLRGRERAAACETLLLRARADLDAGRRREAALQLRIAIEALLAELPGALDDADHKRDIEALKERESALDAVARGALSTELSAEDEANARQTLEIAERVLRRRRVLDI